jgi:hypothetical protein
MPTPFRTRSRSKKTIDNAGPATGVQPVLQRDALEGLGRRSLPALHRAAKDSQEDIRDDFAAYQDGWLHGRDWTEIRGGSR